MSDPPGTLRGIYKLASAPVCAANTAEIYNLGQLHPGSCPMSKNQSELAVQGYHASHGRPLVREHIGFVIGIRQHSARWPSQGEITCGRKAGKQSATDMQL